MCKTPFIIKLTPKEEQKLLENISKPTQQHRTFLRSQIILLCAKGLSNAKIAEELKICRKTVCKWRRRFYEKRLEGLTDLIRSGRPKKFAVEVKYELVHLACTSPDLIFKGITKWSYRKLALGLKLKGAVLKISFTRVMTWLKRLDLKPQKVKYWLHQTDPDFNDKMYKIIQLYHCPLKDGPTISVDEKTGIQILRPIYPDKENRNRNVIYREFNYERKGTVDLIAGLNIQTGKVTGIVTKTHKTKDFIELLKVLQQEYKDEKVIHLVLDNFSSHNSKELREWLSEHPNPFVFHFLPNHGSWLNQIEIWFGIFSRNCLKQASCETKLDMGKLILNYISTYNQYFAHPFKWQYGKELLKQ